MRFRELGWFVCVKELLDFFMFLEFNVGLAGTWELQCC